MDESSSVVSQDISKLNFRKNNYDSSKEKPTSMQKNAERVFNNKPVNLPGDNREEIARMILSRADQQMNARTGDMMKRIDDVFTELLRKS